MKLIFSLFALSAIALFGAEPAALIKGTGPGWRAMTEVDFTNVNCKPDTWSWGKDGLIKCTGNPVGVIRTKKMVTNLELVVQWRHLKHAGNSGVFLWAMPESIKNLEAGKGRLPAGIEVQVLDLGYETNWEKNRGKPSDWFTSHGDVFPTGGARMKAFTPEITYTNKDGTKYVVGKPTSRRSFPTQRLTKGVGEWNHYYIRAINGEVRLWVNGVEVSGGTECQPATGYLCLESEGAPIEFKGLRIRELP
tara:strand:+ start:2718 stop:3464 length:747 start_codon:yes stop_codon:yes gene_type:complete